MSRGESPHGQAPRPLGRQARELLRSAAGGGGPPSGSKARVRAAIGVALATGAGVGLGAGGVGAAKTLAGGSAVGTGSAMGAGGPLLSGAMGAGGAVAGGVALAGGLGVGMKLALLAVAVTAVGGAWLQLMPSRGEPRAHSAASDPEASAVGASIAAAPVEVAPIEAASIEAATVDAEPTTPERAIAMPVEGVIDTADGNPVRRAARVAAERAEVVDDVAPVASTLMQEMELLSPARAALAARDGEAAQALVERYRARYPDGAFAEEFAAIEVEAACMDGAPAADAIRARFDRAHPGSTYATRLARACD